ncbi:hypothetical protein BD779DRAFT_1535172, partial [Infundibulicybe gibba]
MMTTTMVATRTMVTMMVTSPPLVAPGMSPTLPTGSMAIPQRGGGMRMISWTLMNTPMSLTQMKKTYLTMAHPGPLVASFVGEHLVTGPTMLISQQWVQLERSLSLHHVVIQQMWTLQHQANHIYMTPPPRPLHQLLRHYIGDLHLFKGIVFIYGRMKFGG